MSEGESESAEIHTALVDDCMYHPIGYYVVRKAKEVAYRHDASLGPGGDREGAGAPARVSCGALGKKGLASDVYTEISERSGMAVRASVLAALCH